MDGRSIADDIDHGSGALEFAGDVVGVGFGEIGSDEVGESIEGFEGVAIFEIADIGEDLGEGDFFAADAFEDDFVFAGCGSS